MIIESPSGWYMLEEAKRVATILQESDDDWLYTVIDCKNGLGRIDVYDEDGFLIKKGMVLR